MKHLLAFCLLLLFVFAAHAQEQSYFKDLHGIRLKQFREVPQNEFGKPFKTGKHDDGFEYEFYLLKPDSSLYMVFEYSNTDLIWSIQITGTDTTADLGFEGLKFGMEKSQIEKRFGSPTQKIDIGEYGQRWQYDKSNFSFEINPQGKLSSIKINDIPDDTPDLKKLPRFADVLKILTSKNNTEIAKLLAPDMELYRGDQTLFFEKALQTEISNDPTKIFAVIKELAEDLKSVNIKNPAEYEENARMTLGQDIKHVMKFKKGRKIKEIVFKYEWGQFLIWEIKA
jgi:hypothetical protein